MKGEGSEPRIQDEISELSIYRIKVEGRELSIQDERRRKRTEFTG